MRKLLAILLCAVMTTSVFAGCAQEPADNNNDPVEEVGTLEAVVEDEVSSTEAPSTGSAPAAKYHWDFESADGITPVKQDVKAADSINDGANYDLYETDAEVYLTNGPVGNCLYVDGKTGYKLDVESIGSDTYSVSFWVNAESLVTFCPVLQLGRNIGDSGNDRTVAWLNFTTSTWGAGGATIFPVAWNRNSDTGVFPWVYANDSTIHGYNEWAMVTIVVSGEKYTFADDGLERVGAKFYIDGQLAFDASADLALYGGVSPEILSGDGVEAYIGINYWDAVFRGYIDDLYIFDVALSDEDVAALYALGDPNVETVCPVEKPEVFQYAPNIVSSSDALEAIGAVDRTTGWWGDWSSTYPIADGESVVFELRNFGSPANVWNNVATVFTNTQNNLHDFPNDNAADYKEYAVIRADAFGWGDVSYSDVHKVSWNNWPMWSDHMQDADITMTITRNGNEVVVDYWIVSYNFREHAKTSTFTSTLSEDDPCYVFFTVDSCYVEIVSVKDSEGNDVVGGYEVPVVPDAPVTSDSDVSDSDVSDSDVSDSDVSDSDVVEEGYDIGDATSAWWGDWSESVELVDGETSGVTFTNHTHPGMSNWNNYALVLCSVAADFAAHTMPHVLPGYTEYCVVRADRWVNSEDVAPLAGNVTKTDTDGMWINWDQFMTTLNGATVAIDVAREGGVVSINNRVDGTNGLSHEYQVEIDLGASHGVTSDTDLYFFITTDNCNMTDFVVTSDPAVSDSDL